MTEKTLQQIGKAYRKSLEHCSELEQIPHMFADSIQLIEVEDNLEKRELEKYASQIRKSGNERQNTQELTDFVEDLIFTMQHILIWKNFNDEEKIYASFSCRRKSLESDFKKSLQKTYEGRSAKNKDFLGCRCVVDTDPTELKNIEYTYQLTNIFIEFLCDDNPKEKETFISWISKTYTKDQKTISRIKEILSIPFELCEADPIKDLGFNADEHPDVVVPNKSGILDCYKYGTKDYIFEPKKNTYQSVHFVLQIAATSKIHPGCYVEFQTRTIAIHTRCEDKDSLASWDNHKDSHIDDEIAKVFEISDFSDIHIRGYYNDNNGHIQDLTGLCEAIVPLTRNVFSSSKF